MGKPVQCAKEGTGTLEPELDSLSPLVGLYGPLQAGQDYVSPHELNPTGNSELIQP